MEKSGYILFTSIAFQPAYSERAELRTNIIDRPAIRPISKQQGNCLSYYVH